MIRTEPYCCWVCNKPAEFRVLGKQSYMPSYHADWYACAEHKPGGAMTELTVVFEGEHLRIL